MNPSSAKSHDFISIVRLCAISRYLELKTPPSPLRSPLAPSSIFGMRTGWHQLQTILTISETAWWRVRSPFRSSDIRSKTLGGFNLLRKRDHQHIIINGPKWEIRVLQSMALSWRGRNMVTQYGLTLFQDDWNIEAAVAAYSEFVHRLLCWTLFCNGGLWLHPQRPQACISKFKPIFDSLYPNSRLL
jgi:hypothetical protein